MSCDTILQAIWDWQFPANRLGMDAHLLEEIIVSKQKIRITHSGVWYLQGKGDEAKEVELPIGTELTVDQLPAWAAGKFVVIGSAEDKAFQTNADGQSLSELQDQYDALLKSNELLQAQVVTFTNENAQLKADHEAIKTGGSESAKELETTKAELVELRKQFDEKKAKHGKNW